MNKSAVLRLFYSRKQENLFARLNSDQITGDATKFNVSVYRIRDGRLVEVTEAKSSSDPSTFDDAVYLGETTAPGNFVGSRQAEYKGVSNE